MTAEQVFKKAEKLYEDLRKSSVIGTYMATDAERVRTIIEIARFLVEHEDAAIK